MGLFSKEQCAKKECVVECVGCDLTIHLDDTEDFPLCELCCSEEPFLSFLQGDDWAEKIANYLKT